MMDPRDHRSVMQRAQLASSLLSLCLLASCTASKTQSCGVTCSNVDAATDSSTEASACRSDDEWDHDGVPATPCEPWRGQFASVYSGSRHTCGLLPDGRARCWGANESGQSDVPAGVAFLRLTAGGALTCGVRASDESLQCWGHYGYSSFEAPGPFDGVDAAGAYHVCAIRTTDRSAQCWAIEGESDVILPPEDYPAYTPPHAGDMLALSVGRYFACSIRASDQGLECWYPNPYSGETPPAISATQLSVGLTFACALDPDGKPHCWGANERGETTPPAVQLSSISAGDQHACGLEKETGKVVCWGDDAMGQASPPDGEFLSVSSGGSHACAVHAESLLVECWGDDSHGATSPPVAW